MSYLIFTEIIHFVITSLIATLVYRRYRRWLLVLLCFAFGFFIDADHYMDFIFFAHYNPFDLRAFFGSWQYASRGHIYVFFHGYEYVAIFLILAWLVKKWRPVFLAAGLALLGHLLVDQITNQPGPYFYFITYRLMRGFEILKLLPP